MNTTKAQSFLTSVFFVTIGVMQVNLSAIDGAIAKDHHEHASSEISKPKETSKPEKKFASDDSLKKHMNSILSTMMEFERRGPSKGQNGAGKSADPKKEVAKAGAQIDSTVKDIFKTCKLEPAADAALHPILADLLSGARLLKEGKENEGHQLIHKALLKYEDFFDHPGWKHGKEK